MKVNFKSLHPYWVDSQLFAIGGLRSEGEKRKLPDARTREKAVVGFTPRDEKRRSSARRRHVLWPAFLSRLLPPHIVRFLRCLPPTKSPPTPLLRLAG